MPSAISPIADDSPPAPQSVIAVYRPVGAASSTSISSFSVIGSPICTLAPATSPVVASIVALENVAPRRPSRPGAPAEHDDAVAGNGPVAERPVVGDADAAAEHERVGRVAGVVEDGAGDGRQADLVAVVGDAGDDAVADRRRVQRRRRAARRAGRSGGPKQRMSVTAIGRWAAPITSRMTPPTPVLAPPNGSTADGWLWVSALSASVVPSANDTMPALPTNADRTNGRVDGVGGGRAAGRAGDGSVVPSSVVMVGPERLVGAVLAPRLGQRLQLDVGRVATRRRRSGRG